ncbi:MAG: cysteine desulfurase [Bacteroidetes bacterium]|nr:cysteine desulfurase [Bacteroidota bacterium]
MIDVLNIRNQFPILNQKINANTLIYFDNGATVQKPLSVINAINNYYTHSNANIHRGVHTLSRIASELYENSRTTIAHFFNVSNAQQLIFTSGTTESINLIAQGLSKSILTEGDEIILSQYEHHSNILPWQLWAQENNGHLKVIPLNSNQELDLEKFETLITKKTKIISIAHVSNTLGVISNIEKIIKIAKKHNLVIVLDGAQSAPHMQIDLQKLEVDFFVCSAHKMYGPTGVGILYMNEYWLNNLPISKTGGGTIKSVTFNETIYAEGALRFEPGTPNISGVIGFGAAVNFINEIKIENIYKHELELINYIQNKLLELPEVVLYGVSNVKAGVISFNIKNNHPFDVGTLLDKYGIAVRTGHHCTQPLMQFLQIPGTVRVSFAVYNTKQEIDFFIEKLKKVILMLS